MRNVKITESLKKINKKYVSLRDELSSPGTGNNFRSIMNNLLSPVISLETFDKIDSDPEAWENVRTDYKRNLRLVKEYVRLVEEFPEFREEELKSIPIEKRVRLHKTKLSPQDFVISSYERLRGVSYHISGLEN